MQWIWIEFHCLRPVCGFQDMDLLGVSKTNRFWEDCQFNMLRCKWAVFCMKSAPKLSSSCYNGPHGPISMRSFLAATRWGARAGEHSPKRIPLVHLYSIRNHCIKENIALTPLNPHYSNWVGLFWRWNGLHKTTVNCFTFRKVKLQSPLTCQAAVHTPA